MCAASPSAIVPGSGSFLTRGDLPGLAKFHDADGRAVSFFFSLQSIPDESHHTELVLIRDLVREHLHGLNKKDARGLAEDMDAVLALAEEVRLDPRRWRIAYACHGQNFWRKFVLPAPRSIRQLQVGEHFVLAPMLRALEYCTPFGVVIFDRGRARAFVVRGREIQEYNGRMPKENIELHMRGSRPAWDQHVDRHLEEHVRAYFKELAPKVRVFLEAEKLEQVVLGCREYLWGDAEPAFAELEKGVLIGRFAPGEYEMPAAEVREAAYPIFEENRRKRGAVLAQMIKDDPARAAVGVDAVMTRLTEGRVQKLMLGGPVEGAAVEGLIRQAVLTDAEILTFDADEIPGFRGVVAWLRY